MDQVTQVILKWRQLELGSWSRLLDSCLAKLRGEATQFWLHVVGVVMEASTRREEVVRSMIRFMEAASLADFSTR